MERSKKILGFGAVVVIALLAVTLFMADNLTSTTNAAGGGPEMRLTIPGGDCADGTCTVGNGESFTLTVEVVAFPDGGYSLAQSYVDMGSDLVYKPTDAPGDEFVWTECLTSVALRQNLNDTGWLHGCLTGLLPPLPASEYTGTLIELKVNCSEADSTTEVLLIPSGTPPALTNGAVFSDPGGTQTVPKTSNLTVVCGAGNGVPPTMTPEPTEEPTAGPSPTTGPTDVPTDTPEATDTPTPTDTPVPPDQPCGDVDGDGDVTSLDSLFVLWLVADLIDETEKSADVNGDGVVNAVDAALILQKEAGLIGQDALTC